MKCPNDKAIVIKQFDNDPDKFWVDFIAANPKKTEIELLYYFDDQYAQYFAKHAGPHSVNTSFNLSLDVKSNIRAAILNKLPLN